jgi:small subunit ribosomal protein S19e
LARKVYLRPHVGVGALKHWFGGKQRRGVRPNHHREGTGKVIRYCLQQLEKIGVLKKDKRGAELKKNSRIITREGQVDLNRIATQIIQAKNAAATAAAAASAAALAAAAVKK